MSWCCCCRIADVAAVAAVAVAAAAAVVLLLPLGCGGVVPASALIKLNSKFLLREQRCKNFNTGRQGCVGVAAGLLVLLLGPSAMLLQYACD